MEKAQTRACRFLGTLAAFWLLFHAVDKGAKLDQRVKHGWTPVFTGVTTSYATVTVNFAWFLGPLIVVFRAIEGAHDRIFAQGACGSKSTSPLTV